MIANIKRVTPQTRMSFIIMQAENIDNLVCAEIGVFRGLNAVDMLNIDRTMKLYLIDAYTNMGKTDIYLNSVGNTGTGEECKAEARDNLRFYLDKITFVYKQSEDAVNDYPDEFFDYVYIDGDHDYLSAKRDIAIWYPKVKKGGILGGHDIIMESVERALTEFLQENMMRKAGKQIGNGASDWWVFK